MAFYIQKLKINDCYAYQNFEIDATTVDAMKFKHIILTGRNGSGKSTILKALWESIQADMDQPQGKRGVKSTLKSWIENNKSHKAYENWEEQLKRLEQVDYDKSNADSGLKLEALYSSFAGSVIFNYYGAQRLFEPQKITNPTPNEDFEKEIEFKLKGGIFGKLKQYLVNKKVYEAFSRLNKDPETVRVDLFERFENTLKRVLENDSIEFRFLPEKFDFEINDDGRTYSIDHMPDGHSSLFSIVIDLLVRLDLIQAKQKDYSYDPQGIILIDEPEAHLHLALQYEILPIIEAMFPRVQIVAATHSPAVISSMRNAVIYDLSSQQTLTESAAGSSFSELMTGHFGLENEFGPVADKIIEEVKKAVKKGDKNLLQQIISDNANVLENNILKIKIENELIRMEAQD